MNYKLLSWSVLISSFTFGAIERTVAVSLEPSFQSVGLLGIALASAMLAYILKPFE